MATLHMSEAEVARDLHAALAKVQQGVEIIIEQDHHPVAVLKPSAPTRPGRKLSEYLVMAKEYEAALAAAPIPDEHFAKDVQAGIDAAATRSIPRLGTNTLGLVLDSSVLIATERETGAAAGSVSQLLAALASEHSETEFLLSSITVMELEHGLHRANTPEVAAMRRRYLDEVFAILPVEPFTREMGVLAAKIDADMKRAGLTIATADPLIGVTALHYGYGIGTRNIRHFKMIPGLTVIAL